MTWRNLGHERVEIVMYPDYNRNPYIDYHPGKISDEEAKDRELQRNKFRSHIFSVVRERILIYNKYQGPTETHYDQDPKWGPCILHVKDGILVRAYMETYNGDLAGVYLWEVNPEWYTPEGRWATSEYEYLARER